MSYKFANDANKATCNFLGTMGASRSGKKNNYYLEILPDRARVAKISFDDKGEVTEVVEEKPLGKGTDLAEVQKWLDENSGIVRLFIKVDGNYDALLSTLSSLVYKCTDEEVLAATKDTPALVRTCGQTEERAVHFAVALCD
jgi:hypothetical protein